MSQNTRYTSKTNFSDLAVKIQANAAILFPEELILNVVVFKARNEELYMAKLIRPVNHKTFMTTPLVSTSLKSLEQLYWNSIKAVTTIRMRPFWRWKTAEEKVRLRKEKQDADALDKRIAEEALSSNVIKARNNLSIEEKKKFDTAMRDIMSVPGAQMILQGLMAADPAAALGTC